MVGLAAGSEPVGLVAQLILAGMRLQEVRQRTYEPPSQLPGPGETLPRRADDPVVPFASIEEPAVDYGKVADVLGDDRASFRRREHEELQIWKRAKVIALGDRDDVVT